MAKKKQALHAHDATQPSHASAMSEINITPMIDVLLVLLIIFMVVTPLAQSGLDIALPQPPAPDAIKGPPPSSLVLAIDKNGTYTMNNQFVGSLNELDNTLRDFFQAKSDTAFFVCAAGDLPYGRVVEAIDVARGAEVERIGIISEDLLCGCGVWCETEAGG
ncbi:MAG: biopolymer transporter ExbD [Vicinamibacteria bacterium]|nr:biopolymer transporter ExbD [Vicinamibacteria bacterium]